MIPYNAFHVAAANQVRNEPVCVTASGEVHHSPPSDSGWLNQFLQRDSMLVLEVETFI